MQFLDSFDYNKQTSLYVHIPFCKSKCSYCAFYSKTCSEKIIKIYFEKLIEELDYVLRKMDGNSFYTVYIGGGNPGCLSIGQLEILLAKICTFGRPVEFTMEMNPESLTYDHFFLFEKYLTRLSMGVQSLEVKALEFLGRNASFNDTVNGIELALKLREKTGCQISFDLITCLPSWHDYVKDAQLIAQQYKPDHISLYALTLEENTPLFDMNPSLPDSDEQGIILETTWEKLKSFGYEQYEVSNFAMSGKKSLHNSVYWDYQQYIGLGTGAVSTGFVGGKVFRVESEKSVDKYISGDLFSVYSVTELTEEEAFEEFVIMGLRHTKGLDISRLHNEFGKDLSAVPQWFREENGFLVPFDQKGLLTADRAALYVLNLY